MSRDRLDAIFDVSYFSKSFQLLLPDDSCATDGKPTFAFAVHMNTGDAVRELMPRSIGDFGQAYSRGEPVLEPA